MKKTFGCIIFLCAFASGIGFAENKAGLNKFGVIIGYPSGFSYSHNFTRKDQIDCTLAFGFNPFKNRSSLNLAVGYLRTIAEPRMNGTACPLELGGGLEFSPWWDDSHVTHMTMGLYADLRWEIFFASLPNFNIFLDFAPRFNFWSNGVHFYAPRGGLGLRLAF